MAFPSPYILRGSPSQSQSLSFTSTVHENSPFDSEESEATPRLLSRQPTPLSGRSYSVCTEMDIDPPSRATPAAATEVIDLTAEDGPPSPNPPATSPIQSNIASYIWEATNSSGGDHKPVALSAGSDTERVAAGHRRTKSLGKMKVPGGWDEDSESGPSSRAAPVAVGQHTEPSTLPSGMGNTTEFEKIYSMLSQLQEVTKIHDKRIKTIDEDYHLLSTRMDTTEDNVKGIDDGFRELSSRIGKAENTFKGIHQGIQQLSTRMGKSESQRREEAKRREKQRKEDLKARQKAEEIHENRFHTLVRLLNVGPAGSTNMETSGFSSSTSYQSDVLTSDMSQHTHSSQNITVPGGRPARLSGYEDPRKPKASRGKRVKNRLGKSRRHSYTPSIGTGTPQSTPPRNIPNSPASNPPGARVIDIVPDIKPETSFSNHSMPSSQHPQSPTREESSHSPAPGSSSEYQLGSQNSAAN